MSQPIVSEGGTQPLASSTLSDLEPVPPRWVESLFAGRTACLDPGARVAVRSAGDLLLLDTTIEGATALSADLLRDRVADAYRRLGSVLAARSRWPIRFWNFIPDVGRTLAPGLDRYMVFNAGRHDGFTTPLSPRAFQHAFATASAVGVNGIDLVIHCLAAGSAPEPVENPRQRSPWLYSDRYGPLPPCFSRASIAPVAGRKQLLIGGTASIVGEDSRHLLDTGGQLDETFRNLATVVMSARRSDEPVGQALARLIDVRAYVTAEADAGLVRDEITRRCPLAAHVELSRARICRPELLVEIEAVCEL